MFYYLGGYQGKKKNIEDMIHLFDFFESYQPKCQLSLFKELVIPEHLQTKAFVLKLI